MGLVGTEGRDTDSANFARQLILSLDSSYYSPAPWRWGPGDLLQLVHLLTSQEIQSIICSGGVAGKRSPSPGVGGGG